MIKRCIYCSWQRTVKSFRDSRVKYIVCDDCKADGKYDKPASPPPAPQEAG